MTTYSPEWALSLKPKLIERHADVITSNIRSNNVRHEHTATASLNIAGYILVTNQAETWSYKLVCKTLTSDTSFVTAFRAGLVSSSDQCFARHFSFPFYARFPCMSDFRFCGGDDVRGRLILIWGRVEQKWWGYELYGMEQRHVEPFLTTIIMARHFELHSGGVENGDAASGEVFFACFFTFLVVVRAVGEGRTWDLGKRVHRGRAQTVRVISGCLIVMVVRGIRAACLLARYIGSALLQIVKFQHGNPKIRFFCNVNETDF